MGEPDETQRHNNEVLGQLSGAVLQSLAKFGDLDVRANASLLSPGHLLLLFGALLIALSIFLRVSNRFVAMFGFPEFLTVLVVGCVLVAMGALLFVYQFATEHELKRVLIQTAVDIAKEQEAQGSTKQTDTPR